MLFILSCTSLLFGAFPLVIIFMFLFYFCYYGMRYDGSIRAKHHVIHFANDGGDDDEYEPTPEYHKPFNRENFKFN
jgi:hypothetical protein